MKIVQLNVENIKRLKAVEVVPQGDELVVIGGKNDAGKSSLLDAIEMAMAGESATPAQPVRKGAKNGKVVLDLGDLVVTRTFTEAGGRKLVVANKEGARFPSPQAMLDRLYGELAFDPLAFERLDPKPQLELLRELVGLDMSALDGKRAALYDDRTDVNREVKALEVLAQDMPEYVGVPAEEISIAALTAELAAAEAEKNALAPLERRIADLRGKSDAVAARRLAAENEAASIRKRLEDLEVAIAEADEEQIRIADDYEARVEELKTGLSALPDTAAIRAKVEEAENVNRQVRANRQRAEHLKGLEDARGRSKALTSQIEAIDAEKADKLSKTAFPVEGLGIDADGVTWNGLPFEQASTSDRIRVSVAIGLASHPTLKVLLVRDGSLLGKEKLEILSTMAKEAGAQVWLEMLQEAPDGRTTVFIEEGSVKGTEAK